MVDKDDDKRVKSWKLEQIRVGMRNRKIVTSILLKSLDGEIARYFAIADRATRDKEKVLIYEQNSGDADNFDDSEQSKDGETFSSKSQKRLFFLAERAFHARLISFLYQHRSDYQEAFRICLENLKNMARLLHSW